MTSSNDKPQNTTTAALPEHYRRILDNASRVVASWPQWKRDYIQAALAPAPPDPRRCPRRCDTAQTCVGGCVYDR